MYTSHGHHIPTTPLGDELPDIRVRCGGPGVCETCSVEASQYMIKEDSPMDTVTLETTTYVRKQFEVQAVEVTEDNMESVAEWCKGLLMEDHRPYIKVKVSRPLNERQTKAYPGDWVLFAGTGFKVYTPRAFHKTFELPESDILDGGFVGEDDGDEAA